MPDPQVFDEVPAHVWDLSPAAEIRRRGDARARRRRAGAAAGGLALATAIAAPFVLGLGGTPQDRLVAGDTSSPSSSPSSSSGPSRTQSVPEGFDLGAGMGAAGTQVVLSERERDIRDVRICGSATLATAPVSAASDGLVATGLRAAEVPERRVLLVYPDGDAAAVAFRAVERAATSCVDGGSEDVIALGVGAEPGGRSWGYLFPSGDGLGPDDRAGSLLAARVGNAVLVGQWVGGSSDPSAELRLPPDALRVVQELCVFAPGSC